jgi:hypothetical protein
LPIPEKIGAGVRIIGDRNLIFVLLEKISNIGIRFFLYYAEAIQLTAGCRPKPTDCYQQDNDDYHDKQFLHFHLPCFVKSISGEYVWQSECPFPDNRLRQWFAYNSILALDDHTPFAGKIIPDGSESFSG